MLSSFDVDKMMSAKQGIKEKKRKEKQARRAEAEKEAAESCTEAPVITRGPAAWGKPTKVTVTRLDVDAGEGQEEEALGSDINVFEDVVGRCDRHGTPLSLEVLQGTVAGCIKDPTKAKPTPIQVQTTTHSRAFASLVTCLFDDRRNAGAGPSVAATPRISSPSPPRDPGRRSAFSFLPSRRSSPAARGKEGPNSRRKPCLFSLTAAAA